MKTGITILLMLCLTSAFTQTTETDYRNDIQINVGKSMYEFFTYGQDETGINGLTIIASYNGRLNNVFGYGVYGGLIYSNLNYEGYYWQKFMEGEIKLSERYLFIGPKLNVYFYNSKQFQVFGSAGIGIGKNTYKEFFDGEMEEERKSNFNYSYDVQLGMNYYFNENFGVTGALGVKTAFYRIGLTFRY
jgi:hypothetical protein